MFDGFESNRDYLQQCRPNRANHIGNLNKSVNHKYAHISIISDSVSLSDQVRVGFDDFRCLFQLVMYMYLHIFLVDNRIYTSI